MLDILSKFWKTHYKFWKKHYKFWKKHTKAFHLWSLYHDRIRTFYLETNFIYTSNIIEFSKKLAFQSFHSISSPISILKNHNKKPSTRLNNINDHKSWKFPRNKQPKVSLVVSSCFFLPSCRLFYTWLVFHKNFLPVIFIEWCCIISLFCLVFSLSVLSLHDSLFLMTNSKLFLLIAEEELRSKDAIWR